jgi:hypothetical protein
MSFSGLTKQQQYTKEYYQRPEVKERNLKRQQTPEYVEYKRLYDLKNKEHFSKLRRKRRQNAKIVSSYADIDRNWAVHKREGIRNGWKKRKNLNVPFTITPDDVLSLVPKDLKCPIYKMPFVFNINSEWNMSFDRIDNSKGYTKDNLVVVSVRVNTIKNVATVKEMYQVADFYYELEKKLNA